MLTGSCQFHQCIYGCCHGKTYPTTMNEWNGFSLNMAPVSFEIIYSVSFIHSNCFIFFVSFIAVENEIVFVSFHFISIFSSFLPARIRFILFHSFLATISFFVSFFVSFLLWNCHFRQLFHFCFILCGNNFDVLIHT